MLSSSHHTHRIYPVHPLARWPYVKRSTLECEFFDPDLVWCPAWSIFDLEHDCDAVTR